MFQLLFVTLFLFKFRYQILNDISFEKNGYSSHHKLKLIKFFTQIVVSIQKMMRYTELD